VAAVVLHGVALSQYAAVRAAVAEGFALGDVLATEAIQPRAWAKADLAYVTRLAADPALLAAYEEELRDAEDWLGRRVTPLEDDVEAWAALLRTFESQADPFELLEGLTLSLGDLSRLRRRWSLRVNEDGALREKLAELRAQEDLPLPDLTVAPAVLRRSRRWVGAGKTGEDEVRDDGGGDLAAPAAGGLTLDRYASLCAEINVFPKDAARILQKHGLADEAAWAVVDRSWRGVMERDMSLARDYRGLYGHYRAGFAAARMRSTGRLDLSRLKLSGTSLSLAIPPSAAPSFALAKPLGGTSLALDLPRGPALPFVRERPPGATSLTLDLPRGPALPFAPPAAPRPEPQLKAAEPEEAPAQTRDDRDRGPLTGTSLAMDIPHGDGMPFTASAPEPEAAKADDALTAKAAADASNALVETKLALEIPKREALPFVRRAPNALSRRSLSLDILRFDARASAEPGTEAPEMTAPFPVVPAADEPHDRTEILPEAAPPLGSIVAAPPPKAHGRRTSKRKATARHVLGLSLVLMLVAVLVRLRGAPQAPAPVASALPATTASEAPPPSAAPLPPIHAVVATTAAVAPSASIRVGALPVAPSGRVKPAAPPAPPASSAPPSRPRTPDYGI
jgi:hypothetical protein